jgi:hypothetical protein
MTQLKLMLINFLTEEDKFLSIAAKEKSRGLLMQQSNLMLVNMVLEKARSQGHDIALDFYAKHSTATNFNYQGVKKK